MEMKGRVGSSIALTVIVVAFGMVAGCGGGGGGGGGQNDNQPGEETPTPTSVATPGRTATPAGTAILERTATPERTTTAAATSTPAGATPMATATPTGATTNVAFSVTSSAALLGFQFTVTHPTAKGSFSGTADGVNCSTLQRGIFTKNNQDGGNLILSVANTSALLFPVVISCKFDAAGGQSLVPEDLGITANEVTEEGGAVGDPAALTIVGFP